MSPRAKSVRADALALPLEERAALAHDLLVSLDEHDLDDPALVETEWAEEIERRAQEIEDGRAETYSLEEVRAHVRARLAQPR